jgi:hypothetical protein
MRPYFDLFPSENIHLMVFEEHVADPVGSLKEIAGFLGIAPDAFRTVDPAARHASTGESRLSDRGRRIKRHPIGGGFVARVPAPVRRLVGRTFRTTLETKPTVSPELHDRLHRLVEDDIAQVERWLGRPVQAWSRRP